MTMHTLDEINEYLTHLQALRYSTGTLRKLKWILNGFALWLSERFGVLSMNRLQSEHLRQWHRHLSGKNLPTGEPLKAAYINRHLIAVRGWLRYLVRRGAVPATLADELPALKEPDVLPVSVLAHADMRRLLAGIRTDCPEGYRNRAMLEILYSCGLRASELITLDTDHIRLKEKLLLIHGKGGKQRMVPIGRTALKHLETYLVAVRPYLLRHSPDPALFLDGRGHRLHYEQLRRIVHAVAESVRMEVSVTPHTFRRSCATELIRGGAPVYHVKELLGHASLTTLRHYTRLTINDLKATHAKYHPREHDRKE